MSLEPQLIMPGTLAALCIITMIVLGVLVDIWIEAKYGENHPYLKDDNEH